MSTLNNVYFHFLNPNFRLAIAFIMAIGFNYYAIPVIIRIAKEKKLFDVPEGRKAHKNAVPIMGGLGIFSTILIISLVFINTCGLNGDIHTFSMTSLPAIIAGLTILFFIGMKDDMLDISPWKKLTAEIIALFVLTVVGDIRLISLQGFLGIDTLPYFVSVGISMFGGIVIVNAVNLIDGIDGLAASSALLSSLIFGIYFFYAGEVEYSIFSAIVVGALIPYIYFNVFGKENKIFMGDTGSLILGFILTALAFRFNQLNSFPYIYPKLVAAPAFSIAVLFLPLFDTLRIFTIRILQGRSPFSADRNHIHHLLLDLGYKHFPATLILIGCSSLFIAFTYFFNFLGNWKLVAIMLAAATLLTFFVKKKKGKQV